MEDITRAIADQHVKEYDMRMHRLDELLGQARKEVERNPAQADAAAQLEQLTQERDKLADWLKKTKAMPLENWRQEEILKAGPMGIWDAVAQQLEKLVERLER